MDRPSATQLLTSLVRVRWAVLATLVLCAVLSWMRARDVSELPPLLAATATPVALGLALAIIVVRQVALRARPPRTHFYALLATYLLCGALGIFGTLLAFAGDDGSRGALLALGGAIFTLGTAPGPGASR